MKLVIKHIIEKKSDYQKHTIFTFMKNEKYPLDKRIQFYLGMAYFVMSFGDINRHILRIELPKNQDEYQKLINEHTYIDDQHWLWYVEDLRQLGFDKMLIGTQWLTFLWGDNTHASRLLIYRLINLIYNSDSIQRLAIIETLEEGGNVFFSNSAELARCFEKANKIQLKYLGDFHLKLESGHVKNSDRSILEKISIENEKKRETIFNMVNAIFFLLSKWADELLKLATDKIL